MKTTRYLILLIIGFVLLGGWLLLTRLTREPNPTPTTSEGTNPFVSAEAETLIYPDKAFFPGLVNEKHEVIALTDRGEYFTRINLADRAATRLSLEPIDYAPDNVRYAPNGTAAITVRWRRGADEAARTTLYNFVDHTTTELSNKIADVAWLADGQRIIYLFQENEIFYKVAIASQDGANWNLVTNQDIAITDPEITLSPSGKQALISRRYTGINDDEYFTLHPLYLLDLETKKVTELKVSEFAHAPAWSPDGNTFAFLRIKRVDQLAYLSFYTPKTATELTTDVSSIAGQFGWLDATTVVAARPDPADPFAPVTGSSSSLESLFTRLKINGDGTAVPELTSTPPILNLFLLSPTELVMNRNNFLVRRTLPEA